MIVDSQGRVRAVLDWEFSLSNPFQMLCSPPRWLIGKRPCDWDADDIKNYEIHLRLFLEELEVVEDNEQNDIRLSTYVRSSWNSGQFWFHELVFDIQTPEYTPWKEITKIVELPAVPLIAQHTFTIRKMIQLRLYNVKKKLVSCTQT